MFKSTFDLADALRRELGDSWSVADVSPTWVTLSGPKYNLFVDMKNDRGTVTPSLPRSASGAYVSWYPHGVEAPSASFRISRPIKTIANEVQRKVIDALDMMWDGEHGIGAQIEQDRRYHHNITESYQRAYDALGRVMPPHLSQDHHHSVGYASLGMPEVKPFAEEWEVRIRLPIDEAEEFVRSMMKRYQDEQKAKQRSAQ